MHQLSPNYDYIIEYAVSGNPSARVLDYGSGQGILVSRAMERYDSADFYGVDTFEGIYQNWREKIPKDLQGRIQRIENGRIPFPDNHFDVIVSNQVFEHVARPDEVLGELNRVLKPGGRFLALFPTRDVWWEGHLGLWFAHRLDAHPNLQRSYIRAMRRLGRGYYHKDRSVDQWTNHMVTVLRNSCYYHTWRGVVCWWRESFGNNPHSLAPTYMRYRIKCHPKLKVFSPLADTAIAAPVLEFICHKRAGRVLEIVKSGEG